MEVSGKRAKLVTEPCEPCQVKGKSTQADGFCKDCVENMCTTCFQNHTTIKLCRNHVMSSRGQGSLDGNDRASSKEKCKTHTSEYIQYYCPKHDVVTCGHCIVADHTGCKLEFISVLDKKFENSSDFKEIVKSLERLEVENNESKKRLANNRKENKAFLDKALSEIKQFRKEINDQLDNIEREIVSEANKRSNEIEDLLSKLEKMTSRAEQDIADLRKHLDSKIIQGEKLFIFAKEYKPKLSKVDENIAYIKKNNVLKGFTFEQEKQLAGMIRSGIKLGCLRTDTATEEAPAVVQKTLQPIEPRNEVLKRTAEKHVEAKQKFLPPDPRAAGFDVNSRVEDIRPEDMIHIEVNVDHRIHQRIIGQRGRGVRKIQEDFNVDLRFPRANANPDSIVISGNIDDVYDCKDHLLNIEGEFLQDVLDNEYIQSLTQATSKKQDKPRHNGKGFVIKNAPWDSATDTSSTSEFPSFPGASAGTVAPKSSQAWGPGRRY